MADSGDEYVQLGPIRTWFGDTRRITGEHSNTGQHSNTGHHSNTGQHLGVKAPDSHLFTRPPAFTHPLVFLHPGGVDSRALDPTVAGLADTFRVLTPERRGHGRSSGSGLMSTGRMSFENMAADMILFIEQVVGGPVRLAGCSDGAVVALLVALQRPDLVDRLACVAGVFHRDGWGGGVSDGEDQSEFARQLDDMHRADPMLTTDDLADLSVRTLVMIGDDDEVSIEHATQFYRSLPRAELAIVPGTSHGLLVEKPTLCNAILLDFFSHDAVTTYAPIRRA